jgi:hypothetical protein
MLLKEPEKRPTIQEIINHPFSEETQIDMNNHEILGLT